MNNQILRFIPALLVALLLVAARPALANSQTYSGNGATGFGGAVGNGSLIISDDGSGGVDFQFTLAGTTTWATLGNDLVIYLDNGSGGSNTTTANFTDFADGGRQAVSEFNGGTNRSTLVFNGLLTPQYAIDMEAGYGDIFELDNPANFTFVDGAAPGGTSALGLKYTISGAVASLDMPSTDFGIPEYSGSTVNFFAIECSETGYSANEGVGSMVGTQGWGNSQVVTGVNAFITTTTVPEASTVGLVACGMGMLLLLQKRSRRIFEA